MPQVNNAIIMAAGLSSRFAPISYEKPKALVAVKGEVLIERQIRQLQEAGLKEIIIVTGYKQEQFAYLAEKFGVTLVHNPEFQTRNNNGSIWYARKYLKNTYICSADNYFTSNPFESSVAHAYYAAVYADGETAEWCMDTEPDGRISNVTVGGSDTWYMLGHTFWSEDFSRTFCQILEEEYKKPETTDKYWEDLFIEHINEFDMRIKKYDKDFIFEFDSLDELREFDSAYRVESGSAVLQRVSSLLEVKESEITGCKPIKDASGGVVGFSFICNENRYQYEYVSDTLVQK